jgi:hypothetical protein
MLVVRVRRLRGWRRGMLRGLMRMGMDMDMNIVVAPVDAVKL